MTDRSGSASTRASLSSKLAAPGPRAPETAAVDTTRLQMRPAAAAAATNKKIMTKTPYGRTSREVAEKMDAPYFAGMTDEEKEAEWTGTRWAFGILGFLLFGFGLAAFITDLALSPATAPYHGYTVTILTALPYYGLQFSQWNIAIPYHLFVALVGLAMWILLIPPVFDEIFLASTRYGISGYVVVIWIMATLGYTWTFAEVCNAQDFFILYGVTMGLALSMLLFIFNFVVDNRKRYLALLALDMYERSGGEGETGGAMSKSEAEELVSHHAHWRNFYFAVTMFVLLVVFFGTYGITSLQYYQIDTSSVPQAARWWIILSNLIVWFVLTTIIIILFGLRYSDSGNCAPLRKFSTFGIIVLVLESVILLFLAVCFMVAAVVGEPTY